jgi:hypothetical protein
MSEHIDEVSASLADRARPQVANHIRSIAEQTLDALLRIEELLIKYGVAFYKVDVEGTVDVVPFEDVITNLSPQETPFTKPGSGALLRVTAPPAPTKGKRNPRSL